MPGTVAQEHEKIEKICRSTLHTGRNLLSP